MDEGGFAPLMWAAAHSPIAVIGFSLQNGADPQLSGKGAEAALPLACSKGYAGIVKMLCDCGIVVNAYDGMEAQLCSMLHVEIM